MPKIDPTIVNSTFYVYRTVEDAQLGQNAQGTGFVLRVPVRVGLAVHYAITNRHVLTSGASVIRINVGSNATEILDIDPVDWEVHPAGDDIAATPLFQIPSESLRGAAIGAHLLADERYFEFGVGDDAFMVGLFVDHQGISVNRPLARFGNISMLPSADAKVEGREAFILDMHSRSGFSGSPVLAYRTFGADLSDRYGDEVTLDVAPLGREIAKNIRSTSQGSLNFAYSNEVRVKLRTHPDVRLIGIHTGQFQEHWEITAIEQLAPRHEVGTRATRQAVIGLSGMTVVAPAWKIQELLLLSKFQQQQEELKKQADLE
jgi:hypothetical protein